MATVIEFARVSAPHQDRGVDVDDRRLGHQTRLALWLNVVLVAVLLVLGTVVQIGGAVVAQGQVTVASRIKTIAHPVGGVLAALQVANGGRVKRGDVLLQFQATVPQVDASQAEQSLEQLQARRARLTAERDGSPTVLFPAHLSGGARGAVAGERRIFMLSQRERQGAIALLRERIHQIEHQNAAYREQITASLRETALIGPELSGMRRLYDQKLVTVGRRNQIERTVVELQSARAGMAGNIASGRSQIAEIGQQVLAVEQNARALAAKDLAQLDLLLGEQMARSASAKDSFAQTVVRAPQSGVVEGLAYTTIGSAVPANQPIMQIVPDGEAQVVEAQVSPGDRDQLRLGQSVRVRLSTKHSDVDAELAGQLTYISAAPNQDQHSDARFYIVRIELLQSGVGSAAKKKMAFGMPVEVFIGTGTRSLLWYICEPLINSIEHSLKES
ncbi:MAG TPA: HlyD family type I secretion periplasmic adaptor subunit [Sphingomonas sp.]|jgi:HlyD family secretion protein